MWKIIFRKRKKLKKGLVFKIDKTFDPKIKKEIKKFESWLKKECWFPVKVTIHIYNKTFFKALDGEKVVSVFYCPKYKSEEYPYIKISVGDGEESIEDKVMSILADIIYELTHYYQWINGSILPGFIKNWQASRYVNYILDEYLYEEEII